MLPVLASSFRPNSIESNQGNVPDQVEHVVCDLYRASDLLPETYSQWCNESMTSGDLHHRTATRSAVHATAWKQR